MAAGIAQAPETSEHTSIKVRAEHVEAQGKTAQLEAAADGSVAGSVAAAGLEESLWLCPIEDRRRLDSCREGMLEGFSLGSYFLLVDYTGRLFREGKTAISAELAGILERLGSSAESWREPAGETPRGPFVRPFLRRHSREAARSGRTPERETRRQPGGMSGPIMRS